MQGVQGLRASPGALEVLAGQLCTSRLLQHARQHLLIQGLLSAAARVRKLHK